jgi:hypothetical protein
MRTDDCFNFRTLIEAAFGLLAFLSNSRRPTKSPVPKAMFVRLIRCSKTRCQQLLFGRFRTTLACSWHKLCKRVPARHRPARVPVLTPRVDHPTVFLPTHTRRLTPARVARSPITESQLAPAPDQFRCRRRPRASL